MSSTAAARPAAAAVERAARTVIDAGLRDGRSAFLPSAAVWTLQAADELDRCYVQRLNVGKGNFIEKLEMQLAEASPGAVQLAAELLYLNALPLANVSGKAKRKRIEAVLPWLPDPVKIPAELDAALEGGVFSGGVGFKTMLWTQLVHLVAFVQEWWRQDEDIRLQALSDPWAWKAFVEQVGGGNAPSQRNALKYLAFPETFQPIVNVSHRQKIAKAFADLLVAPTGDVDRDLLAIRDALQANSPDRPVSFYEAPWKEVWAPTSSSPAPTRHAWLVRPAVGDPDGTVGLWLSEGIVTVGAHLLPALPAGAGLEQVREAVAAEYGSYDYVAQHELTEGVHRFLAGMAPHDVVVTLNAEVLHLGELSEGPAVREDDGRLRRDVVWSTLDEPVRPGPRAVPARATDDARPGGRPDPGPRATAGAQRGGPGL